MKDSAIGWTDDTVNFWMSCDKISEGCKFCYMYRDMGRTAYDPYEVVRTSDQTFFQAMKWTKKKRRIFTCSWSDFFHEKADDWREEAWDVTQAARTKKGEKHIWQILTKRPERMLECLPEDWEKGYDNIWLGVSIENQERSSRIDELFLVPAAVHWLSIEPIIGPVEGIDYTGIEWVVVGGESGNETGKYKYRPCELEWIEKVVEEAHSYGVPVFVKQLGTHLSKKMGLKDRHGTKMEEWPEHLRFQEYPGDVVAQAPNKYSLDGLLPSVININVLENCVKNGKYHSGLFSPDKKKAAMDVRKVSFAEINRSVALAIGLYLDSHPAITEDAIAQKVADICNEQRVVMKGYRSEEFKKRVFNPTLNGVPSLLQILNESGIHTGQVRDFCMGDVYKLDGSYGTEQIFYKDPRRAEIHVMEKFLSVR
ncbi:MAG: hypothetical protein CMH61_02180 [Nanoarchaeota archaeon]|nr:hypothetical protein [Nanoarchaeota archaeon]